MELLQGIIDYWNEHSRRCDDIENQKMAQRQKAWDLEKVAMLEKIKAHVIVVRD